MHSLALQRLKPHSSSQRLCSCWQLGLSAFLPKCSCWHIKIKGNCYQAALLLGEWGWGPSSSKAELLLLGLLGGWAAMLLYRLLLCSSTSPAPLPAASWSLLWSFLWLVAWSGLCWFWNSSKTLVLGDSGASAAAPGPDGELHGTEERGKVKCKAVVLSLPCLMPAVDQDGLLQ